MKKVRKAVIPAAGFGTRFLPATKAQPKEMLPIVDKPVIQYVVEEIVDAGIEQIILVTGWHKRAIEDHFDRHFELEARLEKDGKLDLLEKVRKISELCDFVYVRQKEALGNGHALLVAREVVGDEPVLMLWGDDFIAAEPSRTKQMIAAYEKYGTTILSGIRTSKPEDTKKYGYVGGAEIADGVIDVAKFVEKPGPDNAPSDLAIVSGFIFTPDIFDALEASVPETIGKGQELYYVDGVNKLMQAGKKVHAIEIKNSRYYDCGNKLEYLKAVVEFGLKHDDLREDFGQYLKNLKF
ncbi:MAG: UTP--glucose-1-phosphate uridylyltransferase [Candidatus Doudnabacteria bacterium RIFCSPLOWO2_02_FULL_48_8]|uniref:UTP--glucose-1-phosphate uridylyltransferase n=1 Tax=Candidatus Doudnabacteria bacterium RIFCSPHIGHO2_01_FULL_46_24 TaxID=1817825 RepID=A0A1F5NVT2_9BACT|nr:MAG: UTP--glucose-1-phosphate uridylyltransferase [Candidatus Doudnabacteria bacterium RIFCSPHIGHO2_01_FULL_46_24]OGE94919.1 MAG: UTP--glucose-1-phosphate uridylyltransferase [Candidatus Doudnabacteria bacterium RIFCSPLOWO2_02_FULL_48_8]